jgi:hypothetical protein
MTRKAYNLQNVVFLIHKRSCDGKYNGQYSEKYTNENRYWAKVVGFSKLHYPSGDSAAGILHRATFNEVMTLPSPVEKRLESR